MIQTILGINPNAIGAGLLAVIVGLFVAFFKGRNVEANEQKAKDIKAVQVAKKVTDDVAAMTPEQRRKELAKWSKLPR